MNPAQKIVILDFGSQTTQLIARRIREQKVYSEIHPYNLALDKLRAMRDAGLMGIVLSGGPASVYDEDAPVCDPGVFNLGLPVLGICYGAQLMTRQLGGRVEAATQREFGKAELEIRDASGLFAGLAPEPTRHQVWMSHGDRIETPAPGFVVTATSAHSPAASLAHTEKPFVAVQFHPEVAHTAIGTDVLKNFVFGICGCAPNWTMQSFIESTVAAIREQVGEGRVICALSGGVDSSVTAALVQRAVGARLTCVHVNNGLMRQGESDAVMRFFKNTSDLNLIDIDATDFFLGRLKGVLIDMQVGQELTRMKFRIPTRGLLGYRSVFMTDTHGMGVMNYIFAEWGPYAGEIQNRVNGVMVVKESATTVAYALFNLQERGRLFLGPGVEVYPGMIIGEHCRQTDLVVNPAKGKKLTNIRAAGSDDAVILTPPLDMSLEESIAYINDDELVEITPKAIRLRKKPGVKAHI